MTKKTLVTKVAKPKDSNPKSRGWCFTWNNYTADNIVYLKSLNVDYMCIGYEVGASGTSHVQGFLYKKNKYRFDEVKKLLVGCHIEKQKGTLAQAIEYCMKDGEFEEIGDRPRQGKRSDLDIIRHDIVKNVPEKEIARKYFSQWCQYRRAFREYKELLTVPKESTIVLYEAQDPSSVKKCQQYIKETHLWFNDFLEKLWPIFYSNQYVYIMVAKTQNIMNIVDTQILQGNLISHIIV